LGVKRYYHKTSLDGVAQLLNSFRSEGHLCCSSDESGRLFFGRVCVIFETEAMPFKYCHTDIYRPCGEHDEARFNCSDFSNFSSLIKAIVVERDINTVDISCNLRNLIVSSKDAIKLDKRYTQWYFNFTD
jgi:hypothetical protein